MKIPTWAPVELAFLLAVVIAVGASVVILRLGSSTMKSEFEQWCTRAGGEALDIRDRTVCIDRKVLLSKEVT